MSDHAELPRQADIVPEHRHGAPSLWLYTLLAAAGVFMLGLAITHGSRIWDALISLGAGLIEAVTILVLVDRRLRRSELAAIRDLPHSVTTGLALVLRRELPIHRYTRAFLARVRVTARNVQARPDLDRYAALIDTGMLLLGEPGSGKTAWMQAMAASRAEIFLKHPRAARSPVLFPIRNWRPGQTLEQALREHIAGFAPVSASAFRRAMKNGRFVFLLDGADEAPDVYPVFRDQLAALRAAFPKVVWSVSTAADSTAPLDLAPVVNAAVLTPKQIAAYKRRKQL